MLVGLDHVIVAVRDLETARQRFADALGLVVSPGGEHEGRGTHNAIARFGLDYVELLAVLDRAQAEQDPRGRALIEYLSRREGLIGYALGCENLGAVVAEARGQGVDVDGPYTGSRRRPDGQLMRWITAYAPGDPWGTRLPFLIHHETPPEVRRSWAPPGGHPSGITRVAGVAVAVQDLDATVRDYRRYLGLEAPDVEDVPTLPARRARFRVRDFVIDLLRPLSIDGGLASFLREQGEGIFLVSLATPDVGRTVEALRRRGTRVGDPTPRRRAPLLDPSQTCGVRVQLVEEPARAAW
ncbi:MAG TPA: VOC family protein [Chloroflexota bacterium]